MKYIAFISITPFESDSLEEIYKWVLQQAETLKLSYESTAITITCNNQPLTLDVLTKAMSHDEAKPWVAGKHGINININITTTDAKHVSMIKVHLNEKIQKDFNHTKDSFRKLLPDGFFGKKGNE